MFNNCFDYEEQHLISLYHEYHLSENLMKKAAIILVLREEYHIPFQILSEKLYEVERQLYRINSLNRLIPELQHMVSEGTLRRLDAYSLTGLKESVQRNIYHQMKDFFRKTKHEEFMKVVALMAKQKTPQKTNSDVDNKPKQSSGVDDPAKEEEEVRNNPYLQEQIKEKDYTGSENIDGMCNDWSDEKYQSEREYNEAQQMKTAPKTERKDSNPLLNTTIRPTQELLEKVSSISGGRVETGKTTTRGTFSDDYEVENYIEPTGVQLLGGGYSNLALSATFKEISTLKKLRKRNQTNARNEEGLLNFTSAVNNDLLERPRPISRDDQINEISSIIHQSPSQVPILKTLEQNHNSIMSTIDNSLSDFNTLQCRFNQLQNPGIQDLSILASIPKLQQEPSLNHLKNPIRDIAKAYFESDSRLNLIVAFSVGLFQSVLKGHRVKLVSKKFKAPDRLYRQFLRDTG